MLTTGVSTYFLNTVLRTLHGLGHVLLMKAVGCEQPNYHHLTDEETESPRDETAST